MELRGLTGSVLVRTSSTLSFEWRCTHWNEIPSRRGRGYPKQIRSPPDDRFELLLVLLRRSRRDNRARKATETDEGTTRNLSCTREGFASDITISETPRTDVGFPTASRSWLVTSIPNVVDADRVRFETSKRNEPSHGTCSVSYDTVAILCTFLVYRDPCRLEA